MTIDNGIAFIPLFLTAFFSIALIIVLFVTRRNQNRCALIITVCAAAVLCIASIYTALHPNLTLYASASSIFALLYLIKQMIPVKQQQTTKESPAAPENIPDIPVLQEEEPVVDVTQTEAVQKLIDAGKGFMIRAADSFSEESGLNTLLDHLNTVIIHETKADGGVILLLDDFEDVLAVKTLSGDFPPPYKLPDDLPHKIVRVETNFRFSQFPLTETIFGAVARSGKAELITDPVSDARIYQNETEDFLKCGTYIFSPLKIRDSVIGVAAIARRFTSVPFNEQDFRNMTILSDFASTAIKVVYSYQEIVEHSELTKEADIACRLQNTLHPKLLPSIPMLSMGCYYKTSAGVCGDYYDIIPARQDRISFVVGDIAGKGMNSLMVMVMLRSILRLTVNTTQSAGTILGWANRGITGETNIDHFASVSLINYDSTTNKIQIATAGTTPVLLYSTATDSMAQISKNHEPVGVEKTTVYLDQEFAVQSGDIIVTYTDGVVETPNSAGIQYSQNRLINLIKKNKQLSGTEIANLVKNDISKFSGSGYQHDDQTLLIIKIQ